MLGAAQRRDSLLQALKERSVALRTIRVEFAR